MGSTLKVSESSKSTTGGKIHQNPTLVYHKLWGKSRDFRNFAILWRLRLTCSHAPPGSTGFNRLKGMHFLVGGGAENSPHHDIVLRTFISFVVNNRRSPSISWCAQGKVLIEFEGLFLSRDGSRGLSEVQSLFQDQRSQRAVSTDSYIRENATG